MDRDTTFIFELLKSQIYTRINWFAPEHNPYEKAAEVFWDSITEDGIMHLNKVKMPDIRGYGKDVNPSSWYVWPTLYAESIMIHHLFNDEYTETNYDRIEQLGVVGPYCLDKVIVEKGDVVIDAGAYIGDWSAVAAQMGGEVYAFEPSPRYNHILNECSRLNNFYVITDGLGDAICQKKLMMDTDPYTEYVNEENGIACNLTTIDEFAKQNDLHIDFIKSDIEGYERNMLMGAKEVLKRDQPKLALCTYHHNKEDAIVLPKIIKDINPNYNIVMKKMKLYAWVG